MTHPESITVLLLGDGPGPALLEAAAAGNGVRVTVRQAPLAGASWLHEAPTPDVAVLGRDAADPLKLGRDVREALPGAELVFLLGTEKLPRLRAALPFAPKLASAWTADADGPLRDIADVVVKAGRLGQERARAALVSARINLRLADRAPSGDLQQRLEQLAISEGYLATLLAQAPVGFIAVDEQLRIVAWNLAAQQLFGHAPDAVAHRPLHEAAPDEVFSALSPLVAQVFDSGAPARSEIRFTAEAGPRWIECTLAPVRDARGQVATVSIAMHDLTERRFAEARLRESEARYRTLTEALPQLVWTALPDGRCDYLSSQWVAYTGIPAEDQLEHGWVERVIHPDDQARTTQHWLAAVNGAVDYDIEYRIRRHDGVYRWFKARATPVRGADGAIAHWFGASTDIEDIVRARELLARSAVELEARVAAEVAERTKAEEALRQAQKMEAVGHLTGGIAHDFNNLLQGITGSLDLVKRRLEQGRTADVTRLMDAALASAQRAAALTHRLLAFSRRQPLDPRPVDANQLVGSMEDLLRRTLGEHIDLAFALADDLWTTSCDPNQLESAVLNLAINARDAMPEGGRLTIETANVVLDEAYAARTPEASPGDYICISVSDTGVGMTPDVLAQAFDPFFTTKPIGQGTGLGLSMIYGFVRQSDGHVQLYSEVGRGSSVKLYLPRNDGKAQPTGPATARSPVEASRRGETVLVIEDEDVVRQLVADVLEDLGYQVRLAADGPQGLEIVHSAAHLDLLVTDIGLPGLNGRQVADAARLRRPGLKVLFMTGYAEKATLSRDGLEPGMGLITKPFAIEALASRVRAMLEGDD